MATEAQIAANQSNAQKSTGPKTAEGKAIISQNNFRFGFTGAFRVLAWESEEEFQILLDTLHAEHQPDTPTETVLVDKMVQSLWLAKRAVLLQDLTFDLKAPFCDTPNLLALYLRYQTKHERVFQKTLADFLKLRAEKRKQQIGFESQQRKQEEEARRKGREQRHQNAEIRKQADNERRAAAEIRKQELHKWSVSLAEAKLDRQLLQNSNSAHSEPGAQRRVFAASSASHAENSQCDREKAA